MTTPRWDLSKVKAIAATADGLRVLKTRALDSFPDRQTAYAAARSMISNLTIGNFAETVQLSLDEADVYGVKLTGRGWYVKLTVREGRDLVVVISFHPLEHRLQTNKGTVLP